MCIPCYRDLSGCQEPPGQYETLQANVMRSSAFQNMGGSPPRLATKSSGVYNRDTFMTPHDKRMAIFAVGGGKGGVGKSIFALTLGIAFARQGKRVVLADLDLGSANLHTYLGITGRTPTIADFILKRVPSLEQVLVETGQKNLRLISGAEFVPGMANPAHWVKLKIIKHLRSLPADCLVVDLGAGVHYNTLDFFGIADKGIVITAPEPGAVLNAYGFIKGALFRKIQHVFRNNHAIASLIEKNDLTADEISLEWFSRKIHDMAPELHPLIDEIERTFSPALVINRVPEGQTNILVQNLIGLSAEKLGISLEHFGNLPNVPEITYYLLGIPRFIDTKEGKLYFSAVQKIARQLGMSRGPEQTGPRKIKADFSDEEVEEVIRLIDALEDRVFMGTSRDVWKMRMYFKPFEVAYFLASRGVSHEAFYQN